MSVWPLQFMATFADEVDVVVVVDVEAAVVFVGVVLLVVVIVGVVLLVVVTVVIVVLPTQLPLIQVPLSHIVPSDSGSPKKH